MDPLTISAIAAGASSLLGGLFGSKSSSSANKTNLAIARETNAANRAIADATNQMNLQIMRENNDWTAAQALKMFNLENEYNSPVEVMKRLSAAGINPAVAMGGSLGSSMTSPADASSPVGQAIPAVTGSPMQAGHVEPIFNRSSPIEAFSAIASGLSALSQSKKNSAEAKRTRELLSYEIDKLIADTRFADANASYQEWQDEMDRFFGQEMRSNANRKQAKEIEQIQEQIKQIGSEIALNSSKQVNFDADTLVKQADKLMKESQANLTQEQYRQLQEQAPVILENLRKLGELYAEQKRTEQSKQNANYASAQVSYAQAKQIRDTLQDVKNNYVEDIKNKKFERVKYALEKKFQALGIGQNPLNRLFSRVLSDDADFNVSAGQILDWINDNSDR